ncbi:Lpg1974 family pore-forming outer membrane protein [Aporhodopirellula aestuarii]|uniref:Lpg1974 family pore-forming outer membrane protein n=1 Tax=Aporhodopirellula aestuarii TaxID=2950107 RepID=A0ABT0U806_9BACT|nr:Lpg1974 family pore-forming outer membrane protein [Aporhodopirellula aestuarii]MCM2372491.1 Lpg1974 family pore-forming outer membrane protein [Aporhodopirellula aestuarii]
MSTKRTHRFLRRLIVGGFVLCGGFTSGTISIAADTDGIPLELVAGLYEESETNSGVETISSTSDALTEQPLQLCAAEGGCLGGAGPAGILEGSLLGGLGSGSAKCPQPWWAHRSGAFGEFLYLTAGSSDLIYAVEGTDPDPAVGTPTGPIGIAQMEGDAGFRTGFSIAASPCSSLNVAYSYWQGSTFDVINADNASGYVLNSQLLHPSLDNTGVSSLQSNADHEISFQTVDLNYRHLWKQAGALAVNWTAGLRYSNLEQTLRSQQTFQVANGLTDVTTDIDFNGFGLTGGLDLKRYSCETGLYIYGQGMASLLAGDWKADYRQANQFDGGEARNSYEDFHATPILEGEIGLGWQSPAGRVTMQSGYTMAGWYSAVTTRGYIDAVRNSDLIDIGETITFSGLTSRVTFQF